MQDERTPVEDRPLRIWLTQDGEPLPTDPGARIMRTGLLARTLADAGHEVTWWASNYSHALKRYRSPGYERLETAPNLGIEMLPTTAYRQNVSIARIVNQQRTAWEFRRRSFGRPKPDLILSCLPTIELSSACIELGSRIGVPVVLDVRDPWPDIFCSVVPSWARSVARLALAPYSRTAAHALRRATALLSTSRRFYEWGLEKGRRARGPQDGVFYLGYEGPQQTPQPPDASKRCAETGRTPSSHGLTCVYVGGFGVMYELEVVVEAARRLAATDGPPVRFVLAGAGIKDDKLRALAAELPNVSFRGWLSSEAIADLLLQADVGIVPCAHDHVNSVPNKVFEYMSRGLALLNNTVADAAEIVSSEGLGLNYRGGSVDDLVDKLRWLATHPLELAAMKERSSVVFRGRYEARSVYSNMAKHLVRVAHSHHKVPNSEITRVL